MKFPTTVEEVKAEEERQARELAGMTPEERERFEKEMEKMVNRSWHKLRIMIEGQG